MPRSHLEFNMVAKIVKVKDIDQQELEALIERVEEAIEHDLALSSDDLSLLLSAIQTLASLQGQLESKDVTLHKLKKLLGMIPSSEKRHRTNGESNTTRNRSSKSKKNRSPRPKAKPAEVVHHKHQSLKKGDPCPKADCDKGKLYPYRPSTLLRITAHAPYEAVKHVVESLRCNLCNEVFSASLPKEVLQDGASNQQYGYSARALMSLNKFFSGQGYYHQGNLSGLMGQRISASTNFDQCEYLANDATPIIYQLKKEAAAANHFLGDDTRHRILEQQPEERPNRNGKGKRLRTGIYSSCLIARTQADHEIVLFDTSLGHFGEFLDSVLKYRPPDLPKPSLMTDALSSNKPTMAPVNAGLCNAHGRRQFSDVEEHFPQEVDYVLEQYGLIWDNEDEAQAKGFNEQQRLAYHKEHSLVVMASLKDWCEEQKTAADFEEHSGLGKAINYFLKHYPGLTAFCRIPGVPLDNNRTEETLKMVIRGRKSYHFFKTANGAGVANVHTSLIATAWRAGINVYEYLIDIQRYKDQVKENPAAWVPYRYEATIAEIKKR
jgi:hypothetical protein